MGLSELQSDGILALLFGVGSAHTLEIMEGTTVMDVGLMDSVVADPVVVTVASLLGLGALVLAYLANTPSWSKLATEEQGAILATVGIMGGGVVAPDLVAPLTDQWMLQLGAWVVEAGGFYAVAYN